MMRRNFLIICVFISVVLFTAGCGTSKKTIADNTKYVQIEKKEDKKETKTKTEDINSIAQALIEEGMTWIGVPYKYGGNDRGGIDCSGFILQVFQKVTELKMPRTSRQQRTFCTDISKEEMVPGDLIFFSSPNSQGNVAHVGMYIGEGKMIHASSSRGVITAAVESSYFIKHYICAGRVPGLDIIKKDLKKEKLKGADVETATETSAPTPETIVKDAFRKR